MELLQKGVRSAFGAPWPSVTEGAGKSLCTSSPTSMRLGRPGTARSALLGWPRPHGNHVNFIPSRCLHISCPFYSTTKYSKRNGSELRESLAMYGNLVTQCLHMIQWQIILFETCCCYRSTSFSLPLKTLTTFGLGIIQSPLLPKHFCLLVFSWSAKYSIMSADIY